MKIPSETLRWMLPARLVTKACGCLFCILLFVACSRNPFPKPEQAFRGTSSKEINDDGDLVALGEALEAQVEHLKESGSGADFKFGKFTVPRSEYLSALSALGQVLKSSISSEQKLIYVQSHFQQLEVYGDKRWGDVFITSYFEPVINGSFQATKTFSRPLYGVPQDLLSLDLASFNEKFKEERKYRARASEKAVLPYYTRHEIDVLGKLKGRGLEICYVDPIDAFFMQIQGSGTIRLSDGKEMRLVFGEKNGAEYHAIGKFLKERLAPKDITLQTIETYLRSIPEQAAQAVLDLNPSYVFFRKSSKPAITSIGVSAVPGRTIATDRRYFPKGALGFMQFEKPVFGSDGTLRWVKTSRLVLDQDTGGAINGPGRVDLFWGRGDDAKQHAGQVKGRGKLFYLIPIS